MEEDQMPDFVIVTGMSGAGRTEAMHVFEDLGYYCVDNLPSSLLADLVRVNESTEHEGGRRRLAVVCDSRNGDFFGDLEAELSSMQEAGVSYKTLFLDAADDKLDVYKRQTSATPIRTLPPRRCSSGSWRRFWAPIASALSPPAATPAS